MAFFSELQDEETFEGIFSFHLKAFREILFAHETIGSMAT
jgi:hypothetical protein